MTFLGLDLEPTTWTGIWLAVAAAALCVPQVVADYLEGRRARHAREDHRLRSLGPP